MSIWGKLIGGAAGMALGGPIGAILGIAAGHGVDKVSYNNLANRNDIYNRSKKEEVFASSVIALSAKLAKADGKVSKNEILTFKKIFEFSKEDEIAVADIFNSAKNSVDGYEVIAKQIYEVFKNEKALLIEILNALFSIAYADGYLHPKEKIMLHNISKFFYFSDQEFDSIYNIFYNRGSKQKADHKSSYKILGVSENLDINDITLKYKKLVKEYHPDRLQGMGLPKEFIELANQKLVAINKAYSEIKNEKTKKD